MWCFCCKSGMKPYKCIYGIVRWLFVVPLHGFIFLRNVQVENRFADKAAPIPNVFQSEIREEKERVVAISLLDFTSAICIFQSHTVTFPHRWCQCYSGMVAQLQDACQGRKRLGLCPPRPRRWIATTCLP